ncbi:hypothetical protein [Magnetospirillum molischianum]|uniref:Lipoprotein n=1 Tax=Magnetospirillum molischianum DSM 120 TaxID=1150626 RepID=H8FTN5_MAGML|nr:hypothetical protein [Magnetospirillum molischianum]CCG41742.1 conserved hypothetical protein [Magnetospirillum molischianum DSM 120]
MRAAALILPLLIVVGCGDVPQPFRHDGPNVALAPVAARSVLVRRIDESPRGAMLADAVVRRLLDSEIPATTRSGGGGGWTLISEAEEGATTTVLRWRLVRADDEIAADLTQTIPAEVWRTPTPRLIDGLAADLVEKAMPVLSGGPTAAPPTPPPAPTTVRLVPLSDLPGDGNAALSNALRKLLEKSGFKPVEGDGAADFVMRVQATVTAAAGGQETLTMVWIVAGADGAELGRISQQGALPKGRLAGPWGSLASDIAAGGIEGLAELVRAAKRK